MSKIKARVLVSCVAGAVLALTGLGGVAQAAPDLQGTATQTVQTVQTAGGLLPASTSWR